MRAGELQVSRFPRLLEVLYSYETGGSERVGSVLAEGLAARNWHVAVAATHSSDGPMRAALVAAGLDCHGLDIEHRGRFGRRWAIFRLCSRLKPDVLHAQHIPMLLLCFWPAWLAGVRRFVVTEHTDHQLRLRPVLRRRLRRYAQRIARITVIHPGLSRYLVEEVGIPEERVRVIVNGVDSDRFAPAARDMVVRRTLGVEDDRVVIGCVARLHPDKDHATLVRAFSDMCASDQEIHAHLVIIGEGETRPAIESLVREAALEGRVTLLGDRSDIDRLMPQLDVFALTSRTEGLPMVPLEAMACGLPCVATAIGGIPDLLQGGGGELVDPGDVAGFTVALGGLCRDPTRRRQLGNAARECVLAGYRQADMVEAYMEELMPPGFDGAGTLAVIGR
jgi:glycosyltransferase involved in cell wall biosynthesis